MDNINAVIIHSEHCPFYLKPNIMQILDTFKNCKCGIMSKNELLKMMKNFEELDSQ